MSRSVPLDQVAAELLAIYQVARRPSTVRKLRHILSRLQATVAPEGQVPTSQDLTTAGIARYLALACPRCSPNTVRGHLGYIRAIASYAAEEGLLDRPPNFRRLMPQRVKPRGGRHLTADQVARLLEHLAGRRARSWKDRRLEALVATAAYAGLRASELLWLRVEDVDLAGRILRVDPHPARGLKTEESEQPVPIAAELAPILEAWLPWTGGSTWFNPGLGGRGPWVGGRPGCRPVDALADAAAACGLGRVTWQTLRRSWGTHAASRWGLTDPEIQAVLRHANPETCRRHYREVDLANLRGIAARVSYRATG